jgi:ligand-binding sensor domain-containing protein/signal transduction histidine kinase
MKGLILLVACLLVSDLAAQTVFFNHIAEEDGLRSGNVRAIVKDHQGFMWIGTEDGLHRYDGYGMKLYRNQEGDSTSLSSNFILCLFEDSHHNLWVGTLGGGLCLYNRKQDNFQSFRHENSVLPSNSVRCIAEGRDRRMYIGSTGLTRIDIKTDSGTVNLENLALPVEQITTANIRINALGEDLDGNLLIGVNPYGVYRFDYSTQTFSPHDISEWETNVLSIYTDKRRNLIWAGTWKNGLLVYEPGTKRHVSLRAGGNPNGLVTNAQLSTIAADSTGNLWIASDHGLVEFPHNEHPFKPHSITTYLPDEKNQTGIHGSIIKTVYVDNQDKLWVGTNYEGVNVYDKHAMNFGTVAMPQLELQGTTHANVTALEQDSNHTLWIGTDGAGLFRMQGKLNQGRDYTLEQIKSCSGLTKIKSLKMDSARNLWIGTWGEGLFTLNTTTHQCRKFNSQALGFNIGNEIMALAESRGGHLWMGTFDQGLYRYTPATRKLIRIRNDRQARNFIDRISALLVDKENNIWTGREGGGLSLCRSGTTINTQVVTTHIDTSTTVTSLYRDTQGTLWIGVPNQGLVAYEPTTGKTTLFGEKLGLGNNVIQGIAEDREGRLWLSTNLGISLFEKTNRKFTNFTKANGLAASQFNRGSAMITDEGTIAFGNIRGVNYFNPAHFKRKNEDIRIALTRLFVNNVEQLVGKPASVLRENVTTTQGIRLKHTQNSFSVEFAALDFNFANITEYAHKLEPFDDDWQMAGTQRMISYTNLPPGEYTLKIRATNTKHEWSSQLCELRVEIVPAWWQTFWFKLGVIFTLIVLTLAIHRIRIHYLVAQQKRLEALVHERTHRLSDANEMLKEQMEEINAINVILAKQRDQITEKNNEIQTQNEELTAQNEQIMEQQDMLLKAQEQLKEINYSLEKLVDERTLKLQHSIQDLNKTVFELDRFVYSASHDLSAPLKSIRGLVEVIHLEKDPSRVYIYTEYIKDTVLKLEIVIKNMVDYSRNVHIQIKPESFNLHDLVAEVIGELAFWPNTADLTYMNQISKDLIIQSDRSRLKVVLHNLISNSIKYADKSKDSNWIQMECEKNGRYWKLNITDNGIGIREEYIDKIFNMYFRATDTSKGSGLGLFIVKETLSKIGGGINVKSEFGVQTTFELLIPQVEAPANT